MTDPRRAVDFIARLAEAWNGGGRNALSPTGREHRAFLSLADLPAELYGTRWDSLSGDQRRDLIFGARRAVELGKLSAWFFGEVYGGGGVAEADRERIQHLESELAEVRRELAAANALALERVFGEGRGA